MKVLDVVSPLLSAGMVLASLAAIHFWTKKQMYARCKAMTVLSLLMMLQLINLLGLHDTPMRVLCLLTALVGVITFTVNFRDLRSYNRLHPRLRK